MEGQEPGKDGLPGQYVNIDLKEIELYDLSGDPGETTNVASENPEIVEKIKSLADKMRSKLGDSLTGVNGNETREAGRVADGEQ
jgi:arylsulfatase